MKNPEDCNILVIGDLALDHTIYGDVNRISPEAPIPILNFKREEYKLGMAGNVVKNIYKMGCNVTFIGSIGFSDKTLIVDEYLNVFCKGGYYLYPRPELPMIIKTRIMANDQQFILRIDKEDIKELEIDSDEKWDRFFENTPDITKFDTIIISDYGKGFITEDLMYEINKRRKEKSLMLVDPNPYGRWDMYWNAYNHPYLIKPNSKELSKTFDSQFYTNYVLETKGKGGMSLYDYLEDKSLTEPILEIPSEARQVFDVTGAGDSVIAVLGVCFDMGFSLMDSVKISNKAAGISVSFPGTYAVTKKDLMGIIANNYDRIQLTNDCNS